jgi:hypothetical protein
VKLPRLIPGRVGHAFGVRALNFQKPLLDFLEAVAALGALCQVLGDGW